VTLLPNENRTAVAFHGGDPRLLVLGPDLEIVLDYPPLVAPGTSQSSPLQPSLVAGAIVIAMLLATPSNAVKRRLRRPTLKSGRRAHLATSQMASATNFSAVFSVFASTTMPGIPGTRRGVMARLGVELQVDRVLHGLGHGQSRC